MTTWLLTDQVALAAISGGWLLLNCACTFPSFHAVLRFHVVRFEAGWVATFAHCAAAKGTRCYWLRRKLGGRSYPCRVDRGAHGSQRWNHAGSREALSNFPCPAAMVPGSYQVMSRQSGLSVTKAAMAWSTADDSFELLGRLPCARRLVRHVTALMAVGRLGSNALTTAACNCWENAGTNVWACCQGPIRVTQDMLW